MGARSAQPQRGSDACAGAGTSSRPLAASTLPEPLATRLEPRILVVGFGNALVADDGAGPAVIGALQGGALPPGVRAELGGSDALCLAALWRGEPEVWIVDAVVSGSPPGTVHRLAHRAVMTAPQRHATAHALSLPECLRWLALAEPRMASVRYRFWGVEVERLDLVETLSPAVATAVLHVASEIGSEARTAVTEARYSRT